MHLVSNKIDLFLSQRQQATGCFAPRATTAEWGGASWWLPCALVLRSNDNFLSSRHYSSTRPGGRGSRTSILIPRGLGVNTHHFFRLFLSLLSEERRSRPRQEAEGGDQKRGGMIRARPAAPPAPPASPASAARRLLYDTTNIWIYPGAWCVERVGPEGAAFLCLLVLLGAVAAAFNHMVEGGEQVWWKDSKQLLNNRELIGRHVLKFYFSRWFCVF